MRLFFLSLFLLPSLVLANEAGERIDGLLEQFFGSGQAPLDSNEIPATIDWSETWVETPSNPNDANLEALRAEIMLEESSLEIFEKEINLARQRVAEANSESDRLQRQLELLDVQIGANQKRLEGYQKQVGVWRERLKQITRERQKQRVELRVYEAAYAELAQSEFLRLENERANQQFETIQWLFSDRKVSEILEDKVQRQQQLQSRQLVVDKLKIARARLESEERQSAVAYGRLSDLLQQEQRTKLALKSMSDGQAVLLSRMNQDLSAQEKSLAQARARQAESTIYLQNLRQSLSTVTDQLENSNIATEVPAVSTAVEEVPAAVRVAPFVWPVQSEVRSFSAVFNDQAYLKQFGRAHKAVDIPVPQGTYVLAAQRGVVEKVAQNGYGYSYIIIKHDDDLYTVYGHISDSVVEVGSVVNQGQIIGNSGGTPGTKGAGYFTTGPHLHFEVFRDGNFLDPALFLPDVD